MPSPSVAAAPRLHFESRTLSRLLGPVFGFGVWALHLLVVYGSEAVACVMGLGTGSRAHQTIFLITLGTVTVAATAVTVLHAVRAYRQWRDVPELRFRTAVTVGCDAIAALAIAWQLFPIALVPVCA